jgi:hypothetical protein
MKGLTSDGVEFEVIPIGSKVKHKKYPELTGKIVAHEFCEGKYSALPYTVAWDNQTSAHDKLGIPPLWPNLESIEVLSES